MKTDAAVNVIGGGLAGVEAAWQIAQRGLNVTLWEMRPARTTAAHVTDHLAELVCSNSLGSDLPDRAGGVLKAEMRRLGSLVLACADESRVPAGGALAVGRDEFAALVTERIEAHPAITVRREEVTAIPDEPVVVATGPLTSDALAGDIARTVGADYMYFYDALAPIVTRDSVNMSVAFVGSRYGRGEVEGGDYLNCPLSKEEYEAFVQALLGAERMQLRGFEVEDPRFFEGCLPVEVLASRGEAALAYGPMRPVGMTDPRTGRRPYAVVQLRQDNAAGTLYNLVGFQTNLKWPEQKRVFGMIPGLENAEFVRYGQMHRNTFINAPLVLNSTMQYKGRGSLFFAGQITGVEGYVGNAGTGIIAGINIARVVSGLQPVAFPAETMLGALAGYVTSAEPEYFQPMKANFGLMPPLAVEVREKRKRYQAYSERAMAALERFITRVLQEGSTVGP